MASRLGDSGDLDREYFANSKRLRGEGSAVDRVNLILADAVHQNASDIHFEPYENEFRVRFRVDGYLRAGASLPIRMRDAIISRIKIMANLDIGERRLPQEGRIKLGFAEFEANGQIDLRVSTMPTLFGEKVTLRILDQRKLPPDLSALGLDQEGLERLQRAVTQTYGMVLVTGPTGSGKTSTLYTCLDGLNSDEVNIMTVEDPVEISFPGINQVQIDDQIGRTFARALRSFLRQDPNIIMVGEIRDLETAEIAVKAALTGHLVLSTLHTNDAPSTINRLLHMGVQPYLVANSVNLICAQRLVRRICRGCAQQATLSSEEIRSSGISLNDSGYVESLRGKGCDQCEGTGYKGRTGLFEVMEMSETLRRLVVNGADVARIREQAQKEGMFTLRESGLRKIRSGITTLDEVLRQTG